ncbi:TetR/AcrR family transcriptional regulator [Rhodococcus sp. D2-41]|uniref:TetR/AcrR family transcriptional regulator n=1 Tax=Speluncibacter jeojiensis TaxID=2710754 RepID=A0A9X4LZH3_9ACTN|nr:helix-turn-helix domain-containing protein [Rhodococcus sp. D2-41]MDG3011574.1 TetR/AcrR family transcriptional regulator [Rhodococcus sp. D2-41]MDG3015069.1 TetR/AcrR family transcriptional regulator [Corynebacteriales bacterium D3-21]
MSDAEGSAGASPRRWAGRTADERIDERRRQLLDAGYQLLGTEGASAVTVRAVTRLSGLSPRYFYESYASREDLLRAVFDDRFAVIHQAVQDAMVGADPGFDAQARASIDATARCLEEDPRLGRALLRESLADDTLRAYAERALPEFVAGVALRAVDVAAVAALDPAELQVLILAVSGVQVSLLLSWCEGLLPLRRGELVDKVVAVVAGIVGSAGLL